MVRLAASISAPALTTTTTVAPVSAIVPWDLFTSYDEWLQLNGSSTRTFSRPRDEASIIATLIERAERAGANLERAAVPPLPQDVGRPSQPHPQARASLDPLPAPRTRRLPPLRSEASGGSKSKQVVAAQQWDRRYSEVTLRARRVDDNLRAHSACTVAAAAGAPTSSSGATGTHADKRRALTPRRHRSRDTHDFRAALIAIRRTRYVAPEKEAAAAAPLARYAQNTRAFDPYRSIWQPRALSSDSRDLFDGDHVHSSVTRITRTRPPPPAHAANPHARTVLPQRTCHGVRVHGLAAAHMPAHGLRARPLYPPPSPLATRSPRLLRGHRM